MRFLSFQHFLKVCFSDLLFSYVTWSGFILFSFKFSFMYLFIYLSVVSVGATMLAQVWLSEDDSECFSPSTMWVLDFTFRWSPQQLHQPKT